MLWSCVQTLVMLNSTLKTWKRMIATSFTWSSTDYWRKPFPFMNKKMLIRHVLYYKTVEFLIYMCFLFNWKNISKLNVLLNVSRIDRKLISLSIYELNYVMNEIQIVNAMLTTFKWITCLDITPVLNLF